MASVVAIVDVDAGKQLAQVSLARLEGKITEPMVPGLVLAKGGPGKLLVATGAGSAGGIDVASGQLEMRGPRRRARAANAPGGAWQSLPSSWPGLGKLPPARDRGLPASTRPARIG